MKSDTAKLVYVALGGAGEIGMNCYLYGAGPAKDRRWIMVDCGVSFGDMESAPGVDLVMPDIAFAAGLGDRLEAIFVTHAHEDHVGALGRLFPRLKPKLIAAPRFTAEILKRKLSELSQPVKAVRVAKWDDPIEAGPFRVSFLHATHSIPDAAMLLIETPSGRIVHTGDFKLDPDPVIGAPTDLARLERIGDEGLLAITCDSTNIFEDGEAGGEHPLRPVLKRLILGAKGAVAATTFASNVARLKTLAEVATECGRSVVLAGRAMSRMIETATETGALNGFPPIVPDDRARSIPRENLFYLVTGSQGEGRAALARIADGSHPTVKLTDGDLVLFSSKTIPGNEKGVYAIYNRLSEQGIHVIDDDMEPIHVSGHGKREEIERIYKALRPQVSIPIHGEHRHLVEHAELAQGWGAKSLVAPNGAMVGLDLNDPRILTHVETGKIYLDGEVLVGALDGVIRDRLKLARQGHVAVSLVMDEEGALFSEPQVKTRGAPASARGENLETMIAGRLDAALEAAPKRDLRSDARVEELAERVVRKATMDVWGKKPVVSIIVTRLEGE